MKIDLEQIRSLLDVVGQTEITELTIESGEEKITIKKAGVPVLATSFDMPVQHLAQAAVPVATASPAAEPAAKNSLDQKNGAADGEANGLVPITSPMVGTFYRASSPTAKAFVDVGDLVKMGQTVCIIEAMKLMNDLPAEITGKVVKVCVENGSTVEYGQTLFMVNPNP